MPRRELAGHEALDPNPVVIGPSSVRLPPTACLVPRKTVPIDSGRMEERQPKCKPANRFESS